MKQLALPAILTAVLCISVLTGKTTLPAQDKIVEAIETKKVPVIDGIENDVCWNDMKWQAIDEVWIPWGEKITSEDFTGRYKITWSSETNLLYFLFEVTDDIVSDKFVFNETTPVYNFDMIEVFIDENNSGGYHVFDGTANNEEQMGTNAENAFVYHIFAKSPGEGETGSKFYALDMMGTSWRNKVDVSYDWHFPEFKYRRVGHITTYEFSLKVFNDTYSIENEANARAILQEGKIMGLILAANDDDQPDVNPKETVRDNMIGSVAVTKERYNDCWKNADDFGTLKLVGIKKE